MIALLFSAAKKTAITAIIAAASNSLPYAPVKIQHSPTCGEVFYYKALYFKRDKQTIIFLDERNNQRITLIEGSGDILISDYLQ